jgi:endosialidase-like protein
VLACFALSPTAQAIDPPPDGGYPGNNTAEGFFALDSLTTGIDNTASGANALRNTTTGSNNTATGFEALNSNTTSGGNTATGNQAMFGDNVHLSTGSANTATGHQALFSYTRGNNNTADGFEALFHNTTGDNNTANGLQALFNNTTGSSNIAIGLGAGENLTTGSNNIDIGNEGVAGESGTIRIGTLGTQQATYIAGILGKTVPKITPVFINSDGKLGTITSSQRFKTEIKPMDKASEAIHALKPVTFRYKRELDPDGTPQFGLVADDVAKVNPGLVVRDEKGEVYTVRYDAVNAMLLNEFLKEHRKNEEQQAIIEQQQKQIEALSAGLQKVSAQLELSKSAPQTVLNDQ